MARFAVLLSAFLLAGCNPFVADTPARPEMSAVAGEAPVVVGPSVLSTTPIAELDCAPARAGRNISCD